MNLEWFDDESVLPSALLIELDEHTRALFKQLKGPFSPLTFGNKLPSGTNCSNELGSATEGNPGACREADRSHTLRIDEGLASQENESPVGIRPAPDEGGKRA